MFGETLFDYQQRLAFESATDRDRDTLEGAKRALFALMRDRQWHSATELAELCAKLGVRSWDRRVRQLRDLGYVVMAERPSEESREWRYRILTDEEASAYRAQEAGK